MIRYRYAELYDCNDIFQLYYDFEMFHAKLRKERNFIFPICESIEFIINIISSNNYDVIVADEDGVVIGFSYTKKLIYNGKTLSIGKCCWSNKPMCKNVARRDVIKALILKSYTSHINIGSEIYNTNKPIQEIYDEVGFTTLKMGTTWRSYIMFNY